ncbi:MAG: hypothetical protein SFU86_25180 [Pirellulaceae bacterium]|nr:hypothetical protein [Pirellulaceae bacterium]
MGATKPKPARPLPRVVQISRILLRPHNRGPVLAAVIVLASIAGLVYAWQRWGVPATRSAEYVITADKVVVTPPPAWIHADVRSEVLRAASFDRLDLRSPDLVEKLARAFALHAWVARVVRVQKEYPARVSVELEYRRPVAAVEITTRGEAGLLFIDAEGVLLPSPDFAQNQAHGLLRIAAGESTPTGVYGSPWGDPRVAGAAQIAAAWGERFRPLGLYRIVATQRMRGEIRYELRTADEARVIWGSAPGHEADGEPAAESKIAALIAHVAEKGPLDRIARETPLDLRTITR